MRIFLIVCTALLAAFTGLPLWRHPAWWVRALDFPRLQLFVVALSVVVVAVLRLDLSRLSTWILIVTAIVCLGYHGWWILPYTRLFPVEVRAATAPDRKRTIKIITANVLTPNRNAAGLLELVREHAPDVLVTLESDRWWQSKLDALEPDYPFTVKCPLDNLYGIHVYSRLPLEDSSVEFLVEDQVPSIHTLIHLDSGHEVRAHFLHPAPPSPTENEESSERDAELIVVAKSVAKSDAPVIVTGDMNDVAWSATTRLFRKISGLLDPRVGRGMFNTFHADHWFMRWPLDHIFHSHHFTLQSIQRLPSFGSDHFPLMSELVYDATRGREQEGLEPAGEEELSWAREQAEALDVESSDVPRPGQASAASVNPLGRRTNLPRPVTHRREPTRGRLRASDLRPRRDRDPRRSSLSGSP